MRVHFVSAPGVSDIERAIISSVLHAHWKVSVLAIAQSKSGLSEEEADARAIKAVRDHADLMFPGLTIDVLPDATQ
jgi:predicted ribosome-associated RNA-binding protein Tma20